LGEVGGAGHFWKNDKGAGWGGIRFDMRKKEIANVLRLLALGEKKVNFKEREFRTFLSEKNEKKLKKKVQCSGQLGGRRGWMDASVQDISKK